MEESNLYLIVFKFLGEKMYNNEFGLKITVDTATILAKVREHKATFVASYDLLIKAFTEQSDAYKVKYAEYAKKVADKTVNSTDEENSPQPPFEPTNRTKDYDFYIAMLEAHNKVNIYLTEVSFNALWRDRWDWTHQHYNALMMYAKAGGSAAMALNAVSGMYAGE